MNKKRAASILFKAISRNFFKIVVYYPKMVYMAFHQSKYTVDEMYAYCLKMIRFAVDTAGLRVEAYGLENIPAEDGFYLCSNHQEKFEVLLFLCLSMHDLLSNDKYVCRRRRFQ